MALPFGATLGEVTGVGILSGALTLGVSKLLDWWRSRVEARRERVYEWHREMQNLFSEVISVGQRLKVKRRTGIDPDEVEELIPVVSDLDARVNTPPQGVVRMVQQDVLEEVQRAASITYHLVHFPAPDRDADSIAGLMRHQYRLLHESDVNTNVEMRNVIEVIGEVHQPEAVDMSEEEAERILDRFEKEADRRMNGAEEMTVDELMQLPWTEVDRVISAEVRQELVQFSVEQYYEKALLEMPRMARRSLNQSQNDLFE